MQLQFDKMTPLERTTRPAIPENVYRPIKRCPNCQSVFLTDDKCEACGRSLRFHPVGEPFGAKSLYGIKERYHQTLPTFVRYYPIFENKKDARAQSYCRHLNNRLSQLLSALSSNEVIANEERRFFYIELMELMDELLRYGESEHIIRSKVEEGLGFSGALITRDLLSYLDSSVLDVSKQLNMTWFKIFLNHRVWGLFRADSLLKFILITATAVTVAVVYFDIIRSQLGK